MLQQAHILFCTAAAGSLPVCTQDLACTLQSQECCSTLDVQPDRMMAHISGSGRQNESRATLQQDQEAIALVILLRTHCRPALETWTPTLGRQFLRMMSRHIGSGKSPRTCSRTISPKTVSGDRGCRACTTEPQRLAQAKAQAAVSLRAHCHAVEASATYGCRQ